MDLVNANNGGKEEFPDFCGSRQKREKVTELVAGDMGCTQA